MDHQALMQAVPGLLRYARSLCEDRALAEDLVQVTVVRALERGSSFRGESALSTWLHRVLHNAWVDHTRRDREVPEEDVWAIVEAKWSDPRHTVDPVDQWESARSVDAVRDALLRLPMSYRTALVLHHMEGATVPEVARVQDISLAAAKQRVRRGRLMFTDALNQAAERRHASIGVPLDCWSARTQVPDYLDSELDEPAARALEAHLAHCPTCPPLYSAVVTSVGALEELRDVDATIPPRLARRLRALVESSA